MIYVLILFLIFFYLLVKMKVDGKFSWYENFDSALNDQTNVMCYNFISIAYQYQKAYFDSFETKA